MSPHPSFSSKVCRPHPSRPNHIPNRVRSPSLIRVFIHVKQTCRVVCIALWDKASVHELVEITGCISGIDYTLISRQTVFVNVVSQRVQNLINQDPGF